MTRGQSHVVGVALMLALTVLALGTVTAGVGSVFESHAAGADSQRVAQQFGDALDAERTTGPRTGHVSFSSGRLTTEERGLRVLRNGSVSETVDVDALVYRSRERQVTYVAGAIVRGRERNGWVERGLSIAESDRPGVLVVGAPTLNASHTTVTGGRTTPLRTNVSHERTNLGSGSFAVAIETAFPAAFEEYVEDDDVTTSRRDFDGDGTESVVVDYPGTRTGYLVVHDLRAEVGNG